MLKTLIKKQLFELNRSFFYDQKKGTLRSKAASAVYIILYVLLIVVVLGGMFTALSLLLCAPFVDEGLDWLYMDLMALIAVMLGVFGGVFSTYSCLYKAKDNDLLLSLPVPVKYVLISRLLSVYLMGLMFSAVVMLPAVIVYFFIARPGFSAVICSLILTVLISVFVFILSCLLGWLVAKISTHLKNRSFVIVLLSLGVIALYYVFCLHAYELIEQLIVNAMTVGNAIRGSAHILYLIGQSGTGDLAALIIITAIVAALLALTYFVLERSFLRIATATDKVAKRKYIEKAEKVGSVRIALLKREFAHLLSSSTYMLNCALGTPLLLIAGAALLIKGQEFVELSAMLQFPSDFLAIMMAIGLCLLSSMNDLTAASVSLEGKGIWIAQSIPVHPKKLLGAKLEMSMLLSGIPLLFCGICVVILFRPAVFVGIMCIVIPILFALMTSAFGLIVNLKRPNLNWQNETVVVKQSIGVLITMLGAWAVAALLGFAYYLLCQALSSIVLLLAIALILAFICIVELRWIYNKGSLIFMYL